MGNSEKEKQNRPERHLPSGTVLAERYQIGQVLGEGGFGITYQGFDLRLEIRVAVKEYFPADLVERSDSDDRTVCCRPSADPAEYAKGVQKFLSEARTMAKMIKYPEIVSIRDYFEEYNTAYIVMEYVEGITFQELVRQRGGSIPSGELFSLLDPLFGALEAVHEAGLLHRDISPDNLMLEGGRVRLLDFGCARVVPDGLDSVTLTISMKQGYGPIEQYQGHGQGPWTDVYGLAATIYYCLTGQTPPQALDRVLEDTLVPPRDLGANITEEQQQALLRGLAVNPKKRYQSIAELFTGLYGSREMVRSQTVQKRRRIPVGIAAAVLVVLAVIAAAAVWIGVRGSRASVQTDQPVQTEPEASSDPADSADQADPTDQTDQPESIEVDTQWLEEAGVLEEHPEAGQNVQVCSTGTEEELIALLEDDDVTAVILPSGFYYSFDKDELIVTKPLKIEADSGFDCYEPIVVSDGGLVWLEGQLCFGGSASVSNGGKIYVQETGILNWNTLLWLDQEDALVLSDGARLIVNGTEYDSLEALTSVPGEYVIVLDTDALFADSVHVASFLEWENLPDTAAAVVIDGDLSVESLAVGVPVMIQKGVTVTVLGEGQAMTEGQILVNQGTLKGTLSRVNDSDTPLEEWVLINYGTIDAQMNLTGGGQLVNCGTLQFTGEIRSADLCNLGTMVCGGSADSYGAGAGTEYLSVRLEGYLYNFGTWTLSQPEGNLDVWLESSTLNRGTVSIEAGAYLHNGNVMTNLGCVHLTQTGAHMVNTGLLDCSYPGSELVGVDGSSWENGDSESDGIVMYNEYTLLALPDNDMEGFLYMDHESGHSGVRVVVTEDGLREALSDESTRVVIAASDLEYEDEIEVRGITLIVEEKYTLRVTGGHGIRVLEGGNLYIRGGALDLEEGTLTLEDYAMLLACCPVEDCRYGSLDVKSENVRILYR